MAKPSWSKANLAEVEAVEHARVGKAFLFGEAHPRERYRDVGVNIRVLEPGQPASVYHSEAVEEFFIVLGGECLAIVEEEEVSLRKWDYLQCAPGTAHVIVGAGDAPSTVLMIGGRRSETPPHYPVSEAAARFGASVRAPTDDSQEAWRQAGWDLRFAPARLPWPPG